MTVTRKNGSGLTNQGPGIVNGGNLRKMQNININEFVRVRLTAYGKDVHERQHYDFWKSLSYETPPVPYVPPKVDEQGYSKFQLWNLMNIFGPEMRICSPQVFENNEIRLD